MNAGVHFYVGPTGYNCPELHALSNEVKIHPPVRRFDLPALIDNYSAQTGTIVLVDGLFHSYPAVGHVEIRDAIDAGWTVWGLSSMGAIRAAEMSTLGMLGYGNLFERYRDDPYFDDDEVTLIHEEEEPYRPFSEPMVHLRECLAALLTAGHLAENEALGVEHSLKQRWFGDRSLTAFRYALQTGTNVDPDGLAAALANFDDYRIKRHDLLAFVARRAWETRDSANR